MQLSFIVTLGYLDDIHNMISTGHPIESLKIKTSLPLKFQNDKRKSIFHDDVIKWKHFPRYWPFVRGIHRSPGNFPHKGQWRGALMFSLICARINGWVNNCEAGDLRRYHAHNNVTVIWSFKNVSPRHHGYLVLHQTLQNDLKVDILVWYNSEWFEYLWLIHLTNFKCLSKIWVRWVKSSHISPVDTC